MKWEIDIRVVIDDEEIEEEMLRLDTAGDRIHTYLAPMGGIESVQAFAFRLADRPKRQDEEDEEDT